MPDAILSEHSELHFGLLDSVCLGALRTLNFLYPKLLRFVNEITPAANDLLPAFLDKLQDIRSNSKEFLVGAALVPEALR